MQRKVRDYQKEAEDKGVDIIYKGKDGNYLLYEKDGFMFKHYRSNWPPVKISAESCTTPTEFFKHQVMKVHGDTYDLSNVNYVNANTKICVICKVHGNFTILPLSFRKGQGCSTCSDIRAGNLRRLTTEDFVERAKVVHGDKYDYSKVNYQAAKIPVEIGCPIHGFFKTTPDNHTSRYGCPKCGRNIGAATKRLNTEEVIKLFKQVHGDRYNYDLVSYTDAHNFVDIVCKDHGVFKQSYANHYHGGKGCPICARILNARLKHDFIKIASKKGYASLYLLYCTGNNESFYKVGITTKTMKGRFGGKGTLPYDYEIKHLFIADGETVWELEKTLHNEYYDVKYTPQLYFGGVTECFSYIDEAEYAKLLQIIV